MAHKKIIPVHHTGRVAHHRHTAYGMLFLLLIATSVPLVVASHQAASAAAEDPVAASQGVYAVVPGQTPNTAPTITSPATNTTIGSTDSVVVQGRCQPGTLLKVFKNEVFAGATLCGSNGSYAVEIDPFMGANLLTVRPYNTNNAQGPTSIPVTVIKQSPDFTAGQQASYQPFFITSDFTYKGVNVGQKLEWSLRLGGGQAPYAVNVSWGDGKTDLISRRDAGDFTISHVYDKPGQGTNNSYDITIITTDQQGIKSFIHLVGVVSGDSASVVSQVQEGYNLSTPIRIGWQLSLVCLLLLASFWLGERRELYIMKRKTLHRA